MAMASLEAVLEAAQTLSHDERRRLMIELDALEAMERPAVPAGREPLAALRALSGSAHAADHNPANVDPVEEARRQSILASGHPSEKEVLEFIEYAADTQGWK